MAEQESDLLLWIVWFDSWSEMGDAGRLARGGTVLDDGCSQPHEKISRRRLRVSRRCRPPFSPPLRYENRINNRKIINKWVVVHDRRWQCTNRRCVLSARSSSEIKRIKKESFCHPSFRRSSSSSSFFFFIVDLLRTLLLVIDVALRRGARASPKSRVLLRRASSKEKREMKER